MAGLASTSADVVENVVLAAPEDGVPSTAFQLLPVLVLFLIAADKFNSWRQSSAGHKEEESAPLSCRAWLMTTAEFIVAFTLFCLSGPGLIVLNKTIYIDLAFSFPMSVSNLGNIVLVVVMRGGYQLGLFHLQRSTLPWGFFMSNVVPLSVCGTLSIVVGNIVYLYLALPLIQILKLGTLVLVMVFGFALGVERFRWGLVLAIITIFSGISLALQSGQASSDSSEAGSQSFFLGLLIMTFGNIMEALRAVILQVSVEKLDFAESLYW